MKIWEEKYRYAVTRFSAMEERLLATGALSQEDAVEIVRGLVYVCEALADQAKLAAAHGTLACDMSTVVDGPGPGVVCNDRGEWLLPCTEPVEGFARLDGRPYCGWHLELIDEPPLMWFDVAKDGTWTPVPEPEL